MIKIRDANERGFADHGWLQARHTFSFAGYRDADYQGFRSLRVMNEDVIAPGQGFGTHPYQNMEIGIAGNRLCLPLAFATPTIARQVSPPNKATYVRN